MTGLLFNLQRFALHDGPGIRTVVFLKGCSLHCLWCQNPESMHREPELQWDARLCLADCVACQASPAVQRAADGVLQIDRAQLSAADLPALCAQCASGALHAVGTEQAVSEVLAQVLRDKPYFARSGGGMTLSGGEPFMQPAFARALLLAAHQAAIHTAVETCLHVPWHYLAPALPYTDLWLTDLKHVEPGPFNAWTGGKVGQVLDNFRQLTEAGVVPVIRIPLIPGFNADEQSLGAMLQFVARETRAQSVHFLPYHTLGRHKYTLLGRPYQAPAQPIDDDHLLQFAAASARDLGLTPVLRGEA